MDQPDPESILSFWFGALDAHGRADRAHRERWWLKDPAFDRTLAERFGDDVEAALAGRLEPWNEAPRSALALVLLCDQLPRNLFRGSGRAFAGDPRAFDAAERAIARGFDRTLSPDERGFLYMPYMHREDLAAQDRAVELFRQMAAVDPVHQYSVDFALKHRAVIAQFGRFPHRNAALGRTSTTAELDHVAQPGTGF
jgi:uncharacterized protein (DUF924 family)